MSKDVYFVEGDCYLYEGNGLPGCGTDRLVTSRAMQYTRLLGDRL